MNINQWSLRSRLTIGIVILSAIGFAAIFYGTSSALKGYLIGQIDTELNSVVGGTAMRLDRGAVIQQDDDDDFDEDDEDDEWEDEQCYECGETSSPCVCESE